MPKSRDFINCIITAGTIVAPAYVVLPVCVAWMVQVPTAIKEALPLTTVQMVGVVEAKLTARLELAVAESVSGVPTVWVTIVGKLIVCPSASTVKLCGTIVAAA